MTTPLIEGTETETGFEWEFNHPKTGHRYNLAYDRKTKRWTVAMYVNRWIQLAVLAKPDRLLRECKIVRLVIPSDCTKS